MKHPKYRSLSTRIVTDVVVFSSLLFAVIMGAFYLFSKKSIQTSNENLTSVTAQNTVLKITEVLHPIERILNNYIWMLEKQNLPTDSIYIITRKVLENNNDIIGCAIAFEPNSFAEQGRYFAPYSCRTDSGLVSLQLGNAQYEYFYMDWYQIPFTKNQSYWSDPYFDEGGANKLLTTYSVPFHTQSENKTEGIMTVDISLDWLSELVSSVKILESGYASIISANGTFISHPDHDFIMNETIFSYALQINNPELRRIGQNMQNGQTGFETVCIHQIKYQLYYTSLPGTQWSLMIMFPQSEMYASLHHLLLFLLLSIIFSLISLALVIRRIVSSKIAPLKHFALTAKEIAHGDFQTKLPTVTTNDEILQLKIAFTYLQQEIQNYILHLQEATIHREKMESELRIARNIQMSLIPKTFPPFPNHPQIDLFAKLEPAREVGGDLYDFFLIDQDHLCFVIGDVSGKGVPASLFMAVTRTLLRTISNQKYSTSSIVNELNQSLASDNEENMFVTMFLGILNLKSGIMTYTNAGHNAPILLAENQKPEAISTAINIPLGVLPQFNFIENSMKLNSNDTLFLYTDGINEAENKQQELYSTERLMQCLKKYQAKDPYNLVQEIYKSVLNFANENEQSDDITIMALSYLGTL